MGRTQKRAAIGTLALTLSLTSAAAWAADAPVHMDLGSGEKTLTAPASASQPVSINSGGSQTSFSAGDSVTPAQYLAIVQTVQTGRQDIQLNAQGVATGGTFIMETLPSSTLASFNVPQGVTAVSTSAASNLTVLNTLSAAGTILGLPSAGRQEFSLAAGNIAVAAGGQITTVVPTALASIFSVSNTPLNLSIAAIHDIVNAGTIASSGALSIAAGGSVTNALPAGTTGVSPVMSAIAGLNIFSGTGNIINSGIIASHTQDIAMSTLQNRDLLINNLGGIIQSYSAINVRESSFAGQALTSIIGGQLTSEAVNLFGGEGVAQVNVEQLNGVLNITAACAQVAVSNSEWVDVGNLSVRDSAIIAATGGSIYLTENIYMPGGKLALLAAQRVVSDHNATSIDLSSADGDGGELTIISGLSLQTHEHAGTMSVSLGTAVGDGQSGINLSGTTVCTDSTADQGNAGNVTLIAAGFTEEETEDGVLASGGYISVDSIYARSANGAGGNVKLIGETGMVVENEAMSIDTSGATGGDIWLAYNAPLVQGAMVSNGSLSAGSIGTATTTDVASINCGIDIWGNISSNGYDGSGGKLTVDAGYGWADLEAVSTAGSNGGSGGDVLFRSVDAQGWTDLWVRTINTSGGDADGQANAGNAGSVSVERACGTWEDIGNIDSIKFRGDIIARGGNNTGTGAAGNGGNVTMSPMAQDDNNGFFFLGKILNGGGDSAAGAGGAGGNVSFQGEGKGLITGKTAMFANLVDNSGGTGVVAGKSGSISTGQFHYISESNLNAALDSGISKFHDLLALETVVRPQQSAQASLPTLEVRVPLTLPTVNFVATETTVHQTAVSNASTNKLAESQTAAVPADGNVVLFTSANQVFMGSSSSGAEVAIVGCAGASLGEDENGYNLHQGQIFADNGDAPVIIKVGKTGVKLNPNSTAVVARGNDKSVRISVLGGSGDEAVVIEGKTSKVSLRAGEELLVSDVDSEEEMIPLDGEGSVIDGQVQRVAGQQSKNVVHRTKVQEALVSVQLMVAGKSIQIGNHARAARRISNHAEASPILGRLMGVGRVEVVGSHIARPSNIVVDRDSKVTATANGAIQMIAGGAFFSPEFDTNVSTALANVKVPARGLCSIEAADKAVRIKDCGGNGDLIAMVGDELVRAYPGQEIAIFQHNPSESEIMPSDGVGRRCVKVHKLSNGLTCVISEFSLPTHLVSSGHMSVLRRAFTSAQKATLNRVLKAAVAINQVTAGHGQYYTQPTKTAMR